MTRVLLCLLFCIECLCSNFMLIPVFLFKSNNTASEQGEQELCVISGFNTTLCWSICVGASRGFAFVEFNTLQEASQWMEMKQVSCRLARLLSQLRELVHVANPVCPKTCIIVIHTVVSGLSLVARELLCFAALCEDRERHLVACFRALPAFKLSIVLVALIWWGLLGVQ